MTENHVTLQSRHQRLTSENHMIPRSRHRSLSTITVADSYIVDHPYKFHKNEKKKFILATLNDGKKKYIVI